MCPEERKSSTFMSESPGWFPAILIVTFRTELSELSPVYIRMTVGAARSESEEGAFANRKKTFRDGRIPHLSGGMALAAREGRMPTSERIACATVVECCSVNAEYRKFPSVVLFVALDAAPIGKASVQSLALPDAIGNLSVAGQAAFVADALPERVARSAMLNAFEGGMRG